MQSSSESDSDDNEFNCEDMDIFETKTNENQLVILIFYYDFLINYARYYDLQ